MLGKIKVGLNTNKPSFRRAGCVINDTENKKAADTVGKCAARLTKTQFTRRVTPVREGFFKVEVFGLVVTFFQKVYDYFFIPLVE